MGLSAGPAVELLGSNAVPMWNNGAAGRSLACCAVALAPLLGSPVLFQAGFC